MEVANNLVSRNMICKANVPTVQFGDAGASSNIVGRFALGECGFNVVLPNPAPEAGEGAGTPEHIAVSAWSLRSYKGTHTETSTKSEVFGTTSSKDTLVGEMNTDVLGGAGLTGAVTEQVLATVHANGSEGFTALDSCTCSFDGQSGGVTIRAYGTSTKNGYTYGVFLIVSGGPMTQSGASTGGLGTLVGWGTFSSGGQPAGTLRLWEHLKIG